MPIIEVKGFDDRFVEPETNRRLIEALTTAFVGVYGEAVRSEVWVLLSGVPRERWGIGGAVRAL